MNDQSAEKPATADDPKAETPATAADAAASAAAAAGEAEEDVARAGEAEESFRDLHDLTTRIAELEAERDELKKQLLYALAETENVRKRAERDRRDAEAFGGTRLARDLLAVHDNLARAMETADAGLRESHPGFFEGLELTQRELLNAFAKHRIEKVAPAKGDRFDPNLHQAMFEAPIAGAEPGAIIEVMQTGFTIAGRLLRPALVGVAKAAPAAGDAAA